jgi:hypothetical protein
MNTEDRIRYLCFQLLSADDDNLNKIAAELSEAIHDHLQQVRLRVLEYAESSKAQ